MDLNPRSRQELLQYGKVSAELCSSGQYADIGKAFQGDFEHWEEEHFEVLPNTTVTTIIDALLTDGVSIEKRAGLEIYKALASNTVGYLKNWHEENGDIPEVTEVITQLVHHVTKLTVYANPTAEYQERTMVTQVNQSKTKQSGPGDVSKLFLKENRYSGGRKEPHKSRWQISLDAFLLFTVGEKDAETMFLKGSTLVYFMEVIKFAVQYAWNTLAERPGKTSEQWSLAVVDV